MRFNFTIIQGAVGALAIIAAATMAAPSPAEAQNAPTCDGAAVTIDMNLGQDPSTAEWYDVVLGTPGNDVISDTRAGTICTGDGNDRVTIRYLSNDTLDLGDGDDFALLVAPSSVPNAGADDFDLFAGEGNDVIVSFDDWDEEFYIDAQEGDDRILLLGEQVGEPGGDNECGCKGAWLLGGEGNDYIYDRAGKSSMWGERGNDRLRAGSDANYLDGGEGIDRCNGGSGNNTYLNCESVPTLAPSASSASQLLVPAGSPLQKSAS